MTARKRILPPYTRRVDDLRHQIGQLLVGVTVILVAMVFGFYLGVFGLFGWYIPAVPIAVLAFVTLWVAPDVGTRADPLIGRLYLLFMGILLIWPPYLVFTAPGLPWISPQRLAMFLLAGVMGYGLAVSSRLRQELTAPLRQQPVLLRLFIFWIMWTVVMLGVSKFSASSAWTKHMFMWHFMFLISVWFALQPGNVRKLMRLMLVAITITSAVVLPEAYYMKPIWADHIPSFLVVDADTLRAIQHGVSRFGEYRARSIFRNSLTYAEYLGMTLPFCLLLIAIARYQVSRVAAVSLLLLLITAGTLTQARSAMAAMVATIPMFVGIWVWRRYRETKAQNDLIAPAMLSAFPAMVLSLAVLVLVHPRVRTMVLGGSGTQNSTDARKDQWAMAIPQIIKNPLGYGMDSLERIVPYYNLGGKYTVDSYPINLLVEYGVPGFLLFTGFFTFAAALGIRVYLNARDDEEMVAGAAAIGIVSFMITRMILSSEGGQGLAFGYAGLIVGLWYRQRLREESEQTMSATMCAGWP